MDVLDYKLNKFYWFWKFKLYLISWKFKYMSALGKVVASFVSTVCLCDLFDKQNWNISILNLIFSRKNRNILFCEADSYSFVLNKEIEKVAEK